MTAGQAAIFLLNSATKCGANSVHRGRTGISLVLSPGKPRVKIVKCRSASGVMRASTKKNDDLNEKYDCRDLIHLNAAGAEVLVALIVKPRMEYYAAHPPAK
jgi:hypothetical protein